MIETKVPKDIRVYKTKIMGPFTLRNIICLTIMGTLDLVIIKYFFAGLNLSRNQWVYMLMIIDCPIAAFGWIEVMGMPLERYLKIILITNFLSPTYRLITNKIYKYKKPEDPKSKKKKAKISKKVLKEHPEYIAYK